MDVTVHLAAITRREKDLSLQHMLQEGEIELIRIMELFRIKDAATLASATWPESCSAVKV